MKMDISKYADYFHDGCIIKITHLKNDIVIAMESSELSESDLKDTIRLSEHSTLKGKLHLERTKAVKYGGQLFYGKLKNEGEWGEILHLGFDGTKTNLLIRWIDRKAKSESISKIQICAEKTWWENIPELKDPFW